MVVISQGSDMASAADSRFGKVKFFIMVNTDTGRCTTNGNPQNLNTLQGARIQAAQSVADIWDGFTN